MNLQLEKTLRKKVRSILESMLNEDQSEFKYVIQNLESLEKLCKLLKTQYERLEKEGNVLAYKPTDYSSGLLINTINSNILSMEDTVKELMEYHSIVKKQVLNKNKG